MDDRNESQMDKMQDENQAINENDPIEAVNPFFGSAQAMVERYTHCTLCGANLHFTHLTDFQRNLTQEIAKCPECGVKNRQILHKLQ